MPPQGAMRVPLDRLLLKPNVSAGASILVISSLVLLYRNSSEDTEPALIREAGDGLYRVLDGRHRFMASVIAGRGDLLCTIEALD
jgi:ParB-like nuclease domain